MRVSAVLELSSVAFLPSKVSHTVCRNMLPSMVARLLLPGHRLYRKIRQRSETNLSALWPVYISWHSYSHKSYTYMPKNGFFFFLLLFFQGPANPDCRMYALPTMVICHLLFG